VSVLLAAASAILFGIGTYLVLQRKLSRIIIGLGLLSHGGNTLLLTAGHGGIEPIIGAGPEDRLADPLPHAMALTTIVITFGVSALLLAMAFRSWILTHDDEVENDVSDTLVARGLFVAKDVADEEQAGAAEQAEAAAIAAEAAGSAIAAEVPGSAT